MSGRIDCRANVVNAENINKLSSCTTVSAYVAECHRSTQRPRRTNLSVMGSVRPDNNKKTTAWHSSRLACKSHPFFFIIFPSRRVQISGFVEDYPVPAITVDTATDVSAVSHAWLMSHPTLRSVIIQPVPPTAVALRAANGSPLNVIGFVVFSLPLGTITHYVEALIVPSLGPDSVLLDNGVMTIFGAVLDWENQILCFPSAGDSIPVVHRTSHPTSRPADPSTASSDPNVSVAAVHHDAEGVDVSLRERVDLKPRHKALVVAFTDCPPAHDFTVGVEPLIMSALYFLESSSSSVFVNIIVARTLATLYACLLYTSPSPRD